MLTYVPASNPTEHPFQVKFYPLCYVPFVNLDPAFSGTFVVASHCSGFIIYRHLSVSCSSLCFRNRNSTLKLSQKRTDTHKNDAINLQRLNRAATATAFNTKTTAHISAEAHAKWDNQWIAGNKSQLLKYSAGYGPVWDLFMSGNVFGSQSLLCQDETMIRWF